MALPGLLIQRSIAWQREHFGQEPNEIDDSVTLDEGSDLSFSSVQNLTPIAASRLMTSSTERRNLNVSWTRMIVIHLMARCLRISPDELVAARTELITADRAKLKRMCLGAVHAGHLSMSVTSMWNRFNEVKRMRILFPDVDLHVLLANSGMYLWSLSALRIENNKSKTGDNDDGGDNTKHGGRKSGNPQNSRGSKNNKQQGGERPDRP